MPIIDWTGISIPFRIENGSIAKSKSTLVSKDGTSNHISESINLIISTLLGEWLTNPDIGNKFRSIIFNSFSDDFDTYITYNLVKYIEDQDKRVVIKEMDIKRDQTTSSIIVSIKWGLNPDVIQNYDTSTYSTDVELKSTNKEVN